MVIQKHHIRYKNKRTFHYRLSTITLMFWTLDFYVVNTSWATAVLWIFQSKINSITIVWSVNRTSAKHHTLHDTGVFVLFTSCSTMGGSASSVTAESPAGRHEFNTTSAPTEGANQRAGRRLTRILNCVQTDRAESRQRGDARLWDTFTANISCF